MRHCERLKDQWKWCSRNLLDMALGKLSHHLLSCKRIQKCRVNSLFGPHVGYKSCLDKVQRIFLLL